MSELYFIGGLAWWVVAAIAFGALAAIVYQFIGLRRRLGGRRAALLTAARAAVYALLVFFLLSPGLVEQRATRLRRPLSLLIDTSASMALAASPGKSRLDLVKEKLLGGKEPLIEKLARDYDLRVYQFHTVLEPLAPSALPQLAARGKGTRLLEIVRQASRDAGAHGAILLVSDGIANGASKAWFDKLTTLSNVEGANDDAALPAPVVAVGVGESRGYVDLRIADLSAPEFAFRNREFKIEVTIEARGLAGKTVPLYFNRGKNLVAGRSVAIDRDDFEQRVTLAYTPKEIGALGFTVSVPAQPGEQIAENNQKEFKVEVRRDKLRVLTLSGSPAWSYRFLRMALKQDPFIDLVSFVFLRTPTDVVDVPDNQLSLIPFPIDEIFLEELKNFDVVFLDDFSYRSYFNVMYLERVHDFVRDGGGLAMLGGVRSFDSGGYADSPLRDVLPVELDGKGRYQSETRARGVLTPSGKAHPVTRLAADPLANEEAWKKMPALKSLNQVLRGRGETLLQAATDGAGGGPPLLTVGKFGKGRTLALMTDDAWRWSFGAVGAKESPQNHLKLVRHAVRWLAQEPMFEQVQIRSIAGSRTPGQKSEFRIQVLNDDFAPAAHAQLKIAVTGAEGDRIPLEAVEEADGDYRADFTPAKEGAYRIEAEAALVGKALGKDQKNFTVEFPYAETEDGRPRPELLKQIAETSRGEFVPIAELDAKTMERVAAQLDRLAPAEIVERREIPLWSMLTTFFIVLVLLSSEWWLRRKWGLI
jgi:uncharacterized membrane protein